MADYREYIMQQLQSGMNQRMQNGPKANPNPIKMPPNLAPQLQGMFGGNARPEDRSLVSYEDYSYGYNGSDPFLVQLAATLNEMNKRILRGGR